MQFQGDRTAELALALGVQEVRPVDLVTAYGTLANGGKEIPHTTILAIKNTDGRGRPAAVRAAGRQAGRQPAGRLHRDRHPGRQHQQERQPVLGQVRDHRARWPPARRRSRPARTTTPRTSTPTATSRRRPTTGRKDGAYALAVGVWNGNSDNSLVSTARSPLFSIDVSTYVWQGFLNEAHRQVAGDELQASRRGPRPGQDRPVHGLRRDIRTRMPSTNGSSPAPSPRRALPRDTCGIDVVVARHRSRTVTTPG